MIPDAIGGYAGRSQACPGIVEAAHDLCDGPCDSPFCPRPRDPPAARWARRSELAVARTGDQPHRSFCLCRRRVLPGLTAFLEAGGARWTRGIRRSKFEVPFDDQPAAFATQYRIGASNWNDHSAVQRRYSLPEGATDASTAPSPGADARENEEALLTTAPLRERASRPTWSFTPRAPAWSQNFPEPAFRQERLHEGALDCARFRACPGDIHAARREHHERHVACECAVGLDEISSAREAARPARESDSLLPRGIGLGHRILELPRRLAIRCAPETQDAREPAPTITLSCDTPELAAKVKRAARPVSNHRREIGVAARTRALRSRRIPFEEATPRPVPAPPRRATHAFCGAVCRVARSFATRRRCRAPQPRNR